MTSYRLWPGLCNSFLAGALELRSGIPQGASPDSGGPDMISAMSTELFLDFIGIRMDSRKAEGLGDYKINLVTPDNGGVKKGPPVIDGYSSSLNFRGTLNKNSGGTHAG